MKIIRLKLCTRCNHGTAYDPEWADVITETTMPWSEANEEIAKREAYKGEYTIEDDVRRDHPAAPHNIEAGEYVTLDGVLYKTTENIPAGEPIIAGQNAIVTTVEEQLHDLTKGE